MSARSEAIAAGRSKYWTGNPCPKGHVAERYITGRCVDCVRIYQNRPEQRAKRDAYYWSNRDAARAQKKLYAAKHAEEARARASAWRKANPEQKRAANAKWAAENPEKQKASAKKWYARNPGKVLAKTRKEQAIRRQRMPSWADLAAIEAIYEEAARLRATGANVHVDHEIPLNGNIVSGLHVHNNLRIVPAVLNMAKGNRFEEGYTVS